MRRYVINEPWPTRLREAWCRWVWCRLVGHDVQVKFSGTRLCRRH